MRVIVALLVFALTAWGSHVVVLGAIPGVIMGKAQEKMAERGIPMDRWVATPRVSPQTQTVVRPAPDLSYAVCRFDVSKGPVFLNAPKWDGYGSLSVFDDRTNNVFVGNLQPGSDFDGVILHAPGQAPLEDGRGYAANGMAVVEMDAPGLALIRRLAPDEESQAASSALVKDAYCGNPER